VTAHPELPPPVERQPSGDSGPVVSLDERRDRDAVSTPKALYRISEVMVLLSLSRSVIYEQIRAGRLRTVKQGSRRLVPHAAIAEYVALLEHESEERAA
jgi:excisionase family DNA binding protein